MRLCSARSTVLLLVLVLSASFVEAQTLPPCTLAQSESWDRAWRALGVIVDDPSATISNRSAERFFGAGNWYPLDGSKHAVCGIAKKWSLYVGAPVTPSELDAHPYIVLSQDFERFIRSLPYRSRRLLEECDGAPCVWGEVTGRDEFTRWLFGLSDLSTLPDLFSCDCTTNPACCSKAYENEPFCGYGPWIAERGHGWRPEIHPIERFWASTMRDGRTVLDLFVIQDSSRRFDTNGDFNRGIEVSTWAPWAPAKLKARTGLAYSVQRGQNVEFAVARRFPVSSSGFNPVRKTWNVAGSEIAIVAPDWLMPQHEACMANAETIHGLVWVTIPLERNRGSSYRSEGGALGVEVSRKGGLDVPLSPLRTPARFSEEILKMRSESRLELKTSTDSEPALVLDVVSVEATGRATTNATLVNLRRYWGLDPSSRIVLEWNAPFRQALWTVARYKGEGPVAEAKAERLNQQLQQGRGGPIQVDWSFAPVTLDNPPPTGSVNVGRSAQPFQYRVELYGGSLIRTARHPRLDRPRAVSGSPPRVGAEAAFLSRVYFEAATQALQRQGPLSARLVVTAQLRDDAGRVGTFSYELPTHTPDVAGRVVDGQLPTPLLDAMARWVILQRKLTVPQATIVGQLKDDWKLNFGSLGRPAAPEQQARIVRLFGLAATEDGDLAADEFQELLRLAVDYSRARWP